MIDNLVVFSVPLCLRCSVEQSVLVNTQTHSCMTWPLYEATCGMLLSLCSLFLSLLCSSTALSVSPLFTTVAPFFLLRFRF